MKASGGTALLPGAKNKIAVVRPGAIVVNQGDRVRISGLHFLRISNGERTETFKMVLN